MKGCKTCREAVRKCESLQDDELCFICDAKLVDVNASQLVKLRNWVVGKVR